MPPLDRPASHAPARGPWLILAALLILCAAKGQWITAGLQVPPDPDTVRDLGFIQGFLDGNWFGDPTTAGAQRWYPPLLHALAALAIRLTASPLLPTWLHAGAWLNLLAPLLFFLMTRRLTTPPAAAAATTVFVLFNTLLTPADAAAGYTPWTLTPALTWPLFFAATWLIAARTRPQRPADAVLIGAAIGLVFLAHTVPAVLLSGMAAAAALAAAGPTWRTLRWLTLLAGVELAIALPFLAPLIADYHLHIANPGPGAWEHPALRDPLTLLPNLAGLAALLCLIHRRPALPPLTTALLAAWIGLCLLFLGRHYACHAAGVTTGVCGLFVVAPHHYHAYLQAGWAVLLGLLAVQPPPKTAATRTIAPRIVAPRTIAPRPIAPRTIALLAIAAAVIAFLTRPEDRELSRLGSTHPELILDQAAYAWIIRYTAPTDLFVTELPSSGTDMGPAAATIMAAGRRLVAPPELHANPYVSWAERNAHRMRYLAGDACGFLTEAAGAQALFLLQRTAPITSPDTTAIFQTPSHTIYRMDPAACAS